MCGRLLQKIGILPKAPKAPTVADSPAAQEPAAPPNISDPQVQQAKQRDKRRRAITSGRQSTILTSPVGVTAPAAPVKTLLGS